jgi:protein-S-isoprenylcysteine O-methyltransferase Ste14
MTTAKVLGALCLAVVPGLIWLGVTGVRHPEMTFWKHSMLLGPFARFRWGLGIVSAVLVLTGSESIFFSTDRSRVVPSIYRRIGQRAGMVMGRGSNA